MPHNRDTFRDLLDQLPQPVLVTAAAQPFPVLWANDAGRALMDGHAALAELPEAEALLALAEDAAAAPAEAKEAVRGRLQGPGSDRRRWLDWTAQATRWDDGPAVRLVAVDVTRDMEAQRAERLLREALDSIPDALVLFDTDDTVLFFNKAYRDFFWYIPPLEQMRGRPFDDVVRLSLTPPRVVTDPLARTDPQAYIEKRRRRLHNPSPEPFELFTAEGRWHLVRERRTPEGRFIGIRSDITDRKRVEERLSQLVKELAESNRELEQFAYVASHDLQEPLRMITSYLQLLERRYRGRIDPTADEFIRHAVDGAARMQRLIQDLLEYSRIGRSGRPMAPVAMAAVLRQALTNLRLTVEENNATVVVPPDGDLPEVLGDPGELVRLFQNLLGNALKYRHPERPPVVTVSVAAEGGHHWRFSIADNGIGIDAAHFDRIFLIFQRLHGREHYSGTGIGLAIAKKIVDRHGGRIRVESEPGRGSTFHVVLAAADPLPPGIG
ncbi:sensor histidine kinase [Caenispirillum bisanense]|uniref:sensor histidine kinase n=1 Tax=Caenispirillum bisanense TaxID=414052 RepID=UPI0031DFE644